MAELGARLALAAELVRNTRCAVDVGTDHGYLIVDLVRSGRVEHGIACDIRPDPLSKAVRQITAAGLQEKITAVLTDGLIGIDGNTVDDVVIAGMGGDLISTIVARAPWLRDPEKHLVLQPMTRAEQLRRWLWENGFAILEEHGAEDAGRLYCVLSVAYSGRAYTPTRLECLTGMLGKSRRPASRAYLLRLAESLRRIAGEMAHSNTPSNNSEENYNLARQIDEIAAQMSV